MATPIATTCKAHSASPLTTDAIDTRNATLLVVFGSQYAGTIADTSISDSEGNTWSMAPVRAVGTGKLRLFYCVPGAKVSATHTFTYTCASGSYPLMMVQAWNTTANLFDAETGGSSDKVTGSITPAQSGDLIVSGWSSAGSSNTSPESSADSSLNLVSPQLTNGTYLIGAHAYLSPKGDANAISVTWSGCSGMGTSVCAVIAAFKTSGAAGTPLPVFLHMRQQQ
jgi:hypothetical protein